MFAETYLHPAAHTPRDCQVRVQAERAIDKVRAVIEVAKYIGKDPTSE